MINTPYFIIRGLTFLKLSVTAFCVFKYILWAIKVPLWSELLALLVEYQQSYCNHSMSVCPYVCLYVRQSLYSKNIGWKITKLLQWIQDMKSSRNVFCRFFKEVQSSCNSLQILFFQENSKMAAMTSLLPIFQTAWNFVHIVLLLCILILCCFHIDKKFNVAAIMIFPKICYDYSSRTTSGRDMGFSSYNVLFSSQSRLF